MQLVTTSASGTTTMSMTAAIFHTILLPTIPSWFHNDSWLKPVKRGGGNTLPDVPAGRPVRSGLSTRGGGIQRPSAERPLSWIREERLAATSAVGMRIAALTGWMHIAGSPSSRLKRAI
jgi:hypothetical protein